MKKKFWLSLITLVVILTALGLLRTSAFKEKEQDIIATLQASQSTSSVIFFQSLSDYAKFINLGIPAVFLLIGLGTKKKALTQKGLLILLAMALSGLIARVIKISVKEPRPYEVDARIKQWSDGGSNSFPSGHTVEVSVAALGFALILFRTPVSIILSVCWALMVMLSRIVLGVHNFTDIVGGMVVGCIGLMIMQNVFERFGKNSP